MRLANLADKNDITDITGSSVNAVLNHAPVPSLNIHDLLPDQRAFNNLQALAKLGLNDNGNTFLVVYLFPKSYNYIFCRFQYSNFFTH